MYVCMYAWLVGFGVLFVFEIAVTDLELIFTRLISNLKQSSCFSHLGSWVYDSYPLLFVIETRSFCVTRTIPEFTIKPRLALNPWILCFGFP